MALPSVRGHRTLKRVASPIGTAVSALHGSLLSKAYGLGSNPDSAAAWLCKLGYLIDFPSASVSTLAQRGVGGGGREHRYCVYGHGNVVGHRSRCRAVSGS